MDSNYTMATDKYKRADAAPLAAGDSVKNIEGCCAFHTAHPDLVGEQY